MENKIDTEAIRKCIGAFFDDLNQQYNVTVSSVSADWLEHFEDGKHDMYILSNIDIKLKV